MRYDPVISRIASYEKRIGDLAKRRSHQDFETQREFADLLFFGLEQFDRPTLLGRIGAIIRHPLRAYRFGIAISNAQLLHKDCCDLSDDV